MPLTVLVVDDDPAIRLSLTDYLELSGYSVIAAANGQQGWDMVQRHRPHLVVTDVVMPQVDGYEFIRQVRQQLEFRLLPVIFLTARTNTSERIRGYQLGCDVYLPKPVDLDELSAIIRNLLDRAQITQVEWQRGLQASPMGTSSPSTLPAMQLTQRERAVLSLLVDGLSNAQIGDRLHLSPRTIEKYVSSLLQKTTTSNRAELLRYAMEHHLVALIGPDLAINAIAAPGLDEPRVPHKHS